MNCRLADTPGLHPGVLYPLDADTRPQHAMSDSGPVTVPVYCQYCRGQVSLQTGDWPVGWRPAKTASVELFECFAQFWLCPYCERSNTGNFPAQIVWVSKGHGPEPMA